MRAQGVQVFFCGTAIDIVLIAHIGRGIACPARSRDATDALAQQTVRALRRQTKRKEKDRGRERAPKPRDRSPSPAPDDDLNSLLNILKPRTGLSAPAPPPIRESALPTRPRARSLSPDFDIGDDIADIMIMDDDDFNLAPKRDKGEPPPKKPKPSLDVEALLGPPVAPGPSRPLPTSATRAQPTDSRAPGPRHSDSYDRDRDWGWQRGRREHGDRGRGKGSKGGMDWGGNQPPKAHVAPPATPAAASPAESLQAPIDTTLGTFPWQCPECPSLFASLPRCLWHLSRAHAYPIRCRLAQEPLPTKKFSCLQCGKGFEVQPPALPPILWTLKGRDTGQCEVLKNDGGGAVKESVFSCMDRSTAKVMSPTAGPLAIVAKGPSRTGPTPRAVLKSKQKIAGVRQTQLNSWKVSA